MPARKWIHRSRNRKPDSFISAIEPSLERTAGQALPSLVVFVVEVLVLLVVVVVVLVEVIVLLVVVVLEVIVVLVAHREDTRILIFSPRPSAEPRHTGAPPNCSYLRTVPTS